MQTKTIDGIKYIGVLEVPELSLQLPVMSHWSLAGLKIAPGRYKRNIIIAGHNYRSHFSRLKTLDIGSKIWFIDVEGNRFEYKVSDITHYLMNNNGHLLATWVNENIECFIQGNLSKSDLEKIINSIYEE